MSFEPRDESLWEMRKRYDNANLMAIATSSRQVFDALRDNFQMLKSLKEHFDFLDKLADADTIEQVRVLMQEMHKERLYLADRGNSNATQTQDRPVQ